jgi:hypothetical protein
MPSAAPSFLLLRFLCRHKENEGAGGTPPILLLGLKVIQKEQQINNLMSSLHSHLYREKQTLPSHLFQALYAFRHRRMRREECFNSATTA